MPEPTGTDNRPVLSKEIIINVSEHETRIAILEEGKLVELLVERAEAERMVGNIYKGKVTNVLPGMQAAFIDIGAEKAAFLHASDAGEVVTGDEESEESADEAEKPQRGRGDSDREDERRFRSIQEVVAKGQEILVQIVKEPISTKGPRVTTEISLPGRFIVLVPAWKQVRVSKRIEGWPERRRLRRIVTELLPPGLGAIVRTEGEGKTEREFKADIKLLVHTWKKILRQAARKGAPALIHKEFGITSSIIRDLFTRDVDRLVIDSRKEYKLILGYLRSVAPELREKVSLYAESVPIFDLYGIESEIEKMLDRKIWIKRGAYIVIDQTEAVVAIDVNTGRFVGKGNQEQTIFRTNLEAAKEVARQIRLRDIGGLIIIDFIDMYSRENRRRLFEEFRAGFKNDRSKFSISPVSEFGLIEMTRERVRPSLMYTFSEPCPTCSGFGRVLSRETVATKIERWFKRAKAGAKYKRFKLIISPYLAEAIVDANPSRVRQVAQEFKVEIDVIRDTTMPPEEFRVIAAQDGKDITELFSA